jgi:hypothetical protein
LIARIGDVISRPHHRNNGVRYPFVKFIFGIS